MRTPSDILEIELSKLNPNHFIRLFYKINRIAVIRIITSIQIEAWNSAVRSIQEKYESDTDFSVKTITELLR